MKAGLEQQKSAIDSELKLVEEALEQLRTGERSRKEEMERISREVESMKRDMPKVSPRVRGESICSRIADRCLLAP